MRDTWDPQLKGRMQAAASKKVWPKTQMFFTKWSNFEYQALLCPRVLHALAIVATMPNMQKAASEETAFAITLVAGA
jgi:hypothetical protein